MKSPYFLLLLLVLTTFSFSKPVTGIVRDSETGRAIAAASIAVSKPKRELTSNREGVFQFPAGETQKIKLTIGAAGYYSREYVITDLSRALSASLKPELSPLDEGMGLVIGVLRDAEIGAPIENAEVFSAYSSFSASDESGYFSLTGESDESVKVNLRHPEYRDTSISVTFSNGRVATYQKISWMPKVLRSSLAGSVNGTVLDEKAKPLSGATVTILNSEQVIQSSSNGDYAFDTLYAGKHTLLATALGYGPKIFSLTLKDQEKLNHNIILQPKSLEGNEYARLEGKVFTPDAVPFGGAVVSIDSLSRSVRTDDMGNYLFDSLPGGVFSLSATGEGFDITKVHDVDLWTGETINTDIVLLEKKISDTPIFAKGNGGITGVIVSAADANPIGGAKVLLIDQNSSRKYEAVTEMDGTFIVEARPGIYTLSITSAGFKKSSTENVPVSESNATHLDFIMESSDMNTMAKLTVRGVAVKSGNAALLKERQQSFEVVDAVGAEQFSKTGASSAADAMRQITGATIVDGKYVIVRGLPAKYSLVMLNGSLVPSSDPDENAVNMDIFPTGIIDNIKVYKTFQSVRPANFAGGIIDIGTKSFPEVPTFNVSLSGTYNSQTTFSDQFLTSEQGKTWAFGFDDGTRELPQIIDETPKEVINELPGIISDGVISPEEEEKAALINPIAKSLSTEMTPHRKTAMPNMNSAISFGNSNRWGDKKLGYNLSLTYKNERKMKRDQIYREYLVTNPNRLYTAKDFTVNDSKERVLWSILGNGSFKLNGDHSLNLDYLMLHDGENQIKEINGTFPNSEAEFGHEFYTTRLHYIERHMNYLKASGSHRFYAKYTPIDLFWNGSYTNSTQDEPDLRDYYHFYYPETDQYQLIGTMGDPKHAWRSVENRMGTGDLGLKIPFYQWSSDSATMSLGGGWQGNVMQRNSREFFYDMGSLQADSAPYTSIIEENLGYEDTDTGLNVGILVDEITQGSAQREGSQHVFSQFVQLELPITNKISTILGVRGEYVNMHDHTTNEEQKVKSEAATLKEYDILPTGIVTFKPNDKQVIKGAFGKTLIRPSLREKAPYQTAGFTGGGYFIGNPDLEISYIYNTDIRWELFPKAGELLAVGGFYKRIKNPIETSFLNNDVQTPINSSTDANIVGIETEIAKRFSLPRDQKVTLSGNLTLVYSRVNLDSTNMKNEIYFPDEPMYRPFQGQSPVVINMVASWDFEKPGLNSSIYYNFFGKRLAELTSVDEPYLWEKPEHLLNFTASKKFKNDLKLSFKAKNLLNPEKIYYQEYKGEEYIKKSSRKGVEFSLGVSYQFRGR